MAEYPNNYALLNKLMYALFISGDDSGNIPNWKENMERYDREIITLGERLIKYCPEQNIRLEATARLAFWHCLMGRQSIGRTIYETLPPQNLCQENQIWWSLEEKEKMDFLRKKIRQDYDSLRSFIWLMADTEMLPDKEAVEVMKKVLALDQLIWEEENFYDGWGSARIPLNLAIRYTRLGDYENAYEQLRKAVKAAEAFDHRPENQLFHSSLLGEVERKRQEFETTDNRTLCEIMQEEWLKDEAFDIMRDSREFQEILTLIEN